MHQCVAMFAYLHNMKTNLPFSPILLTESQNYRKEFF